MKKIAFTLCSNNYLAVASLLADSFMEKNPDFIFYIGLVDKVEPSVSYPVSSNLLILPCEKVLPSALLQRMASNYKIVELNTSLKPFYFNFLFSQYEDCKVVYLDPDIYIYNSFKEVMQLLDQYDFLITPHCLSPIPMDNSFPSERSFMKYGIYNLGFIGIRKSEQGLSFVNWWQERLAQWCYSEPGLGLYVDQSWAEFLPVFFEKVYISRNPGWNCAFWNLHERFFEILPEGIQVNREYPLVFFHFSSFDLGSVETLARNQTRYHFDTRQDTRKIFEDYATSFKRAREKYRADIPCYYTHRSLSGRLGYYWNRFQIRKKLAI